MKTTMYRLAIAFYAAIVCCFAVTVGGQPPGEVGEDMDTFQNACCQAVPGCYANVTTCAGKLKHNCTGAEAWSLRDGDSRSECVDVTPGGGACSQSKALYECATQHICIWSESLNACVIDVDLALLVPEICNNPQGCPTPGPPAGD